jgi:hypothetical protein
LLQTFPNRTKERKFWQLIDETSKNLQKDGKESFLGNAVEKYTFFTENLIRKSRNKTDLNEFNQTNLLVPLLGSLSVIILLMFISPQILENLMMIVSVRTKNY